VPEVGSVMVTDNGLDQLEAIPLPSVALTRTLKAFVDPGVTVHLWDSIPDAPELTRYVVDSVPSPQSNVYTSWSPTSGSVAQVS
jgi:hypothetical protein